jgi:hypothetical protein
LNSERVSGFSTTVRTRRNGLTRHLQRKYSAGSPSFGNGDPVREDRRELANALFLIEVRTRRLFVPYFSLDCATAGRALRIRSSSKSQESLNGPR